MATSDPTPSAAAPRERRRHARVAATWPISLSLPDGSFGARLRDVSEAGLCFHLDRQIPEMAVLEVAFELPAGDGPRPVRGHGVVVRCQPLSPRVDHYEIAVFFHQLDGESRAALRSYVAGHA